MSARLLPALWLLLLLGLLSGCRDSPGEVLSGASKAAVQGDFSALQTRFGVDTRRRLERAWQRAGTPDGDGWDHIATGLVFEGPEGRTLLEVVEENIYGDYAEVVTKAGAAKRRYYLRKVDGKWGIELGVQIRYQKAMERAIQEDPKKAKKKSKASDDDDEE